MSSIPCQLLGWLLLTAISSSTTDFKASAPPFIVFHGAGPLFQVLVHRNIIYVGGRNYIYQLNHTIADDNLHLVHKLKTGPVADDSNCLPEPETCSRPRHLTDDDTQVLLMVPSEVLNFSSSAEAVLSCGNVRQGLCRFHSALDITKYQTIGRPSNNVNYVGGGRTTVAFFAGGSHSLFTGAEYDGRPLNLSRHDFSSRKLSRVDGEVFFEYTQQNPTNLSVLDLYPQFEQRHQVRFVYGFSHGEFAYFVTTQNIDDVIVTRLGRVCLEDTNFSSFMELSLRCKNNGVIYGFAMAAFFSDWKSVNSGFELFVAFSKIEETTKKLNSSVICSFSISNLDKSFARAAHSCFSGRPLHNKYFTYISISVIDAFRDQKTLCTRFVS